MELMLPLFPTTSRLLESDSLKYLLQQEMQSGIQLLRTIAQLDGSGANKEMLTSLELQMEKHRNEATYLTEISRIITDTQNNFG